MRPRLASQVNCSQGRSQDFLGGDKTEGLGTLESPSEVQGQSSGEGLAGDKC